MDKTYHHASSEQQAQALWEQHKIYAFENTSHKKVFSIDTPPPTVSGNLHIGHIFSYTHTDLIARYKRMMGYNVFYPMGFDDNGLPTERFVEKQHKTKAHLHKRSDFIALCLKESAIVEKEFEALWKKIGLSIDWNTVYSTISEPVRKISQYSFIDLYNKGLMEHKEEPALYCTTCRTSVAQAELDSAEFSSTFNTIVFTSEDGKELEVATTRPELLGACVALFFNPDDARYAHLHKNVATTPLFNKKVMCIADEAVDKEKGTGLVMCCTFGDTTDIAWYKKHKLPYIELVGRDGVWTKKDPLLAGLRVHEARKKILELLKDAGALKAQKSIVHAVQVHERCKQEIEYIVLRQWFIKILHNKEHFLAAADNITWTPAFMKARYKDWVKNLAWDWCISRQRFYGIPFPVWHCLDCKAIIVAQPSELPIDPQETNYKKPCPSCKGTSIAADTDVMDTWATSSLTPYINAGWPEQKRNISIPMNMRPQAHDIIRTWAFDTIVKSYYHSNTIPWQNIVISGHVLAGQEKISKSQDNAKLSPQGLLERFPADAIRYWAAKGRLGTDTAFSEQQLMIGNRLLIKMWNAFRFCKDHIEGYVRTDRTLHLDDLNKWILHRFSEVRANYNRFFEAYDYAHALDEIESFFWNDFCDNYLEMIKDQMFNPGKYEAESAQGTRFALYEIGYGILQLFAPFIPHCTETLYQLLFKKSEHSPCLHATVFEAPRFSYHFEESADLIATVIELLDEVRKLKSDHALSLKTPLAKLTIHCPDKTLAERLEKQKVILAGITQAQKIDLSLEPLETPVLTQEETLWHAKIGKSGL